MNCNLPETLQHLVDDHQAFENVLARLYRIAFRIVRNREDAEDVVQQSLFNALRGEDTFKGHCLLTTWLGQIVRNQARKLLHRRWHFPHVSVEEEIAALKTPNLETTWNNQIDRAQILAALPAWLTDAEADLVHLYYVQGWSCQEIAHFCGRTPTAIRQLLCRALSKLRKHFTPDPCYEATKAGRHSRRLLRSAVGWESH
jgi:RNA polymerase sigma-70 factor (ECF subfamily)